MDKLLEEGVIEPSNSAWSSPVVMHLKPDGTRRPCIDFRKINESTKKDVYPLPNMHEILSKLRNARYISTLDSTFKYGFTIPGRELSIYAIAFRPKQQPRNVSEVNGWNHYARNGWQSILLFR